MTRADLEFENRGVLNYAAIRKSDSIHLIYRAVRIGNHSNIGFCRLDGPLKVAEQWDKPFSVPDFE